MARTSSAARLLLLLGVAACCTALAAAQAAPANATQAPPRKKAQLQPYNGTNLMDAPSKVPIMRLPSLAPTILELLKLDNVKGNMPQDPSKPLRLHELMPKLPTLPAFESPNFGPATTEAELSSNATAASASLLVPLVESTMIPSYLAGLRGRVADETAWLQRFNNDTAKQAAMCGVFGSKISSCVQFTANMQLAKIQAIASGFTVLKQMEAQLNGEMARKLNAFNLPSKSALGGNWLCEVGGDLSTTIREAAKKSKSPSYAAKAANARAKLNDFITGRWAASPWWHLPEGTQLAPLAAPCPLVS